MEEALSALFATFSRYAEPPEAEWRFFCDHLKRAHFSPGETLIAAGEPPGSFHFILHGLVRFHYPDPAGREFVKCFASEGDIVGPLVAWMAGEHSPTDIDAIERTSTLSFPARLLAELKLRNPVWEKIVHGYTDALARRSETRTEELLRLTPAQRYTRFIEREAHIHARLPLRQIAAYLGITPISLSRIRRRMGIIHG